MPDVAIVLITLLCIITNSRTFGINMISVAAAASPCPATLFVFDESVCI